jgi:tRNA dimethylallyltransferase
MIQYSGKIIVISGPTASGKTDIAVKLAKKINGYVINGGSRQVYKYLTIGTSKPIEEIENSGIRHFLYDIVDPKDNFTIYEYQSKVQKVLDTEKGIPIIVGGSGLYIDSIVFNYDLKQNINNEDLSSLSLEELQKKASKYIKYMTESDKKNRHRLIRVIQRGGLGRQSGKALNNIYFVLDIPRDNLIANIEKRVEKMFENGLLEENKKLLSMGYTYKDRGMKSIGYIEFEAYFDGLISIEYVKEEIVKHTIDYAKRQRTWFKRNRNAIWVDNYEDILYFASNFIRGV